MSHFWKERLVVPVAVGGDPNAVEPFALCFGAASMWLQRLSVTARTADDSIDRMSWKVYLWQVPAFRCVRQYIYTYLDNHRIC